MTDDTSLTALLRTALPAHGHTRTLSRSLAARCESGRGSA